MSEQDDEQKMVPFVVTEEEFKEKIVQRLLHEDIPIDLFRNVKNKKMTRLYYPIRIFEGTYEGHWTAQEGVDEERLVVRSPHRNWFLKMTDPPENAHLTAPRLTSEVQTSWHHISGYLAPSHFEIVSPAYEHKGMELYGLPAKFLNCTVDELMNSESVEINSKNVADDVHILLPNISREVTWKTKVADNVKKLAFQELDSQFEGMKIRNQSISLSRSYVTRLFYLPIWQFEYSYNDKLYYYVMDGRGGGLLGSQPVSSAINIYREKKKSLESEMHSAEAMGCLMYSLWGCAIVAFVCAFLCKTTDEMIGCFCVSFACVVIPFLLEKRREKAKVEDQKMEQKVQKMDRALSEVDKRKTDEAKFLFDSTPSEEDVLPDIGTLLSVESVGADSPGSSHHIEGSVESESSAPPVGGNRTPSTSQAEPPSLPGIVLPPALPAQAAMPNIPQAVAKKRHVYVLLAVFLGWLGIHNFYAGYNGRAVFQLLISSLFWIPIPIIWLWALIEACVVKKSANGNPFS